MDMENTAGGSFAAANHPYLSGGGEMGARMRQFDWSSHPLGPIGSWPQSLRTSVSICLDSRFPILLWWGPDLIMLYNDAYRPILGSSKHPRALGQKGRECWPEIWEVIGPMLEGVITGGAATWSDDQLLVLDRNGYLEECYFTFSYSPIRDESGDVGGVFTAVTETTERVLGERRMKTLRDLAARTTHARSLQAVVSTAMETLDENPLDLPFGLLYQLEEGQPVARLTRAIGVPAEHPWCAPQVRIQDCRPLAEAVNSGKPVVVDELCGMGAGVVPAGPWPAPPHQGLVLPIALPGRSKPMLLLFAGASARRALDDAYRSFFDLLAAQIAAVLAEVCAHEQERRRAEMLVELDRAKTVFFNDVSHEFRTPLTLMLGPLEEVLARGPAAYPAELQEPLAMVYRNALRLLKLVNTLLDFSRIEAGRLQAVYEPTDLAALTAELASVFRSATDRAGIRLNVQCPPLPEPVHVDADLWEKIVLNLLSNALKFTFEGEIRVSLSWQGGHVELRVADTGVGIPEAELPKLFQRFYRVRSARARSSEGSGIGLSLVQELVRLHGGAVQAHSQLGRGTTVTVRIPTGCAHLPADRLGAERDLVPTAVGAYPFVEEALRWLPGAERAAGPADEPPQSRARQDGPVGARVLVADDNADMREYLRRLLGQRWQVAVAADGAAALEVARGWTPDLVVADVMMPGLDGFALLRALREDSVLRELPVVLLSARAGEEARIEGLQAGADDYLPKPFASRELIARVASQLELRRVRERAKTSLREKERFIHRITEMAPAIFYLYDFSERRLRYVSSYATQVLGLSAETDGGRIPPEWMERIHPEDRSALYAHGQALGELREGESLELECRVRDAGGHWTWLCFCHRVLSAGSASRSREILGVAHDISRQKETEGALREADRRKDDFIATLAHELRNPLAPIANSLSLIRLAGGNGRVQTALDISERQLKHLARLVDDLLEVSRITCGKIQLRKEWVPLDTVIDTALETAHGVIEAAGHELRVDLPTEPVYLHLDTIRMAQVVANLLINAAKYTHPCGRIELRARPGAGRLAISVQDTGIGIAADMLPRVFDMFAQVRSPQQAMSSGLGIGLALVKGLVELHDGEVHAESPGLGKGSTFTLTLPLEAPSVALPPAPASPEAPALSGTPRSILVVDDNADIADSTCAVLRALGHEVRVAYDGESAIRTALSYRPQAILLDLGMPGMDGYEVAMQLRRRSELRQARLIALTGWGQDSDRRRSRSAGFDCHLTKPVMTDELLKALSPSEERGAVEGPG